METGTWDAMTGTITITDQDLDDIASSFTLLDLSGRVPLKFGHNDEQPLTDGQPALGWVSKLYRDGKKLLGDFTDIPKVVYDLIKAGRYKYLSVELLGSVKAGSRVIPWVLDAVALLGADQPAIGTLQDLQSLTMARGSGLQSSVRAALTRATLSLQSTGGHKPPMADEEMKARLEAAEREATDAKRKLQELSDKTHQEKLTAHRAKLLEVFEAPIKAKEILPAVREQFKRAYNFDTDAILNFTVSDAESFAKMHPNPEAPKKVHTAGGIDPNDPLEKSIASVKKDAAEAFARGSAKTPDQAVIDAVKANFRSNPQLAQAWRDAPGYVNR